MKTMENYIENQASQKLHDGMTLTHLLLLMEPTFLHLEEPWVDKLLAIEQNIKDIIGRNCLTFLLRSEKLKYINFSNPRFLSLLEK